MPTATDRLDLRLSVEDKNRLRRAAELHGYYPKLELICPP